MAKKDDGLSHEIADEQGKEMTEPVEEKVLDIERDLDFSHTGLSRMSTSWGEHDSVIRELLAGIDGIILDRFADAYRIMEEIYEVVREPEVNEVTGEVRVDHLGLIVWRRSPTGGYYEDWARMGATQREHFIYKITTNIFVWSQNAADLWTESMFAKAVWQEAFATAFDAPMSGTIEDRTAVGNIKSAERRYFAVYCAALSRKADAVVRSMELLNQRLKDIDLG